MRNKSRVQRLGRVIARRTLTCVGDDLREIVVSIGAPRRHTKGDWECPYSIQGLAKPHYGAAFGVDALQALILAIEGLRVNLDATGNLYSWLESDPDKADFGIPRYIPTQFGRPFESRISIAIEQETKRYYQSIIKNRKADIAEFEAEINARRQVVSAMEAALSRRKAGISRWEADLKKSRPEKTRRVTD